MNYAYIDVFYETSYQYSNANKINDNVMRQIPGIVYYNIIYLHSLMLIKLCFLGLLIFEKLNIHQF